MADDSLIDDLADAIRVAAREHGWLPMDEPYDEFPWSMLPAMTQDAYRADARALLGRYEIQPRRLSGED